jgi:hypothetical protein
MALTTHLGQLWQARHVAQQQHAEAVVGADQLFEQLQARALEDASLQARHLG